MMRVRALTVVALAVMLALSAPPAAAQANIEVPRGKGFTVENANECVPNIEATATFVDGDGDETIAGVAITDPNGHFKIRAEVPASTPLGAGTITVACGLEGSLLTYDVAVVEPTELELTEYIPHAAAALGAIVLLLGIRAWIRRRKAKAEAGSAIAMPPAPAPVPEPIEDHDDDPEYWFWDNETERGPVKRLACLSEAGFYLHEVVLEDFNPLLDRLAAMGPEQALGHAFFSVGVDEIDEVHYRGSQVRVTFHRDGERQFRVIDLGTEAQDVVDLLSRRVPVIADSAASVV